MKILDLDLLARYCPHQYKMVCEYCLSLPCKFCGKSQKAHYSEKDNFACGMYVLPDNARKSRKEFDPL